MPRIAFVTNNPPPYRIPVFERLGRMPGVTLRALFCARREPYRHWDLPQMHFDHVFLRERYIGIGDKYIHNNPDVIPALRRFAPDVVVTDGFYPTQLYAFGHAFMKGIAHIPLTDGTYLSEQALSRVHKVVRRIVFARSNAFLSASRGGDRLYQSYGIPPQACFQSALCIDNERYRQAAAAAKKEFDMLFCGRMEPGKNPLFALDVAAATARILGRKVTLLFVGSGSQEEKARAAASAHAGFVDAHFHGFAQQGELPALYASARLFLFPSLADVWGVVANEACAAGLPVIVSPHAGAAGELIVDGQNGHVCPLVESEWAKRAAMMLAQEETWRRYSRHSLSLVSEYTFDKAAAGFLDACRYALSAAAPAKVRMPV